MWFSLDRFNNFIIFSSKGWPPQCLTVIKNVSSFPPSLSPFLSLTVSCVMFKCSTQETKAFICVPVTPSRLDCLTESNSTERTHFSSHLSEFQSVFLSSSFYLTHIHTYALMYTHMLMQPEF